MMIGVNYVEIMGIYKGPLPSELGSDVMEKSLQSVGNTATVLSNSGFRCNTTKFLLCLESFALQFYSEASIYH